MIGYQGVEAKMLVINGVEKEDYVGMCQSSLEEFSASSLLFFSFFFLFNACQSTGGGHVKFTIQSSS